MVNSVGHNTGEMRNWTNNINDAKGDYEATVTDLYQNIDILVSSEFCGGLAQEFENIVLDKKQAFLDVAETLGEAAEMISSTANKIDQDEADLASRFRSVV
ncbi:MAG: hypothetical protein IKQ29_01905 [Bacilli bacterium]|nr:hypothetical protein [Bacilli bacterium]